MKIFPQHKRLDCYKADIGSREGFRDIYEQYGHFVYSVCFKYIGNKEECDDLTSKIFLSLWERRDTLKIEGPIENYLYKAAKLQVFDYFKLEARRENRLRKAIHEFYLFDSVVENEVWYLDLLNQLNQAIENLPVQRREVFRLNKLEGLSIKETGAQMSLSENTIKTHLSKALVQLRQQLSDFTIPARPTGS